MIFNVFTKILSFPALSFFFRIYGSTGLYGDPRTRLQVMPGHRTGFSVRYIGKSRGSLTCSFNASILHRLSLFFT